VNLIREVNPMKARGLVPISQFYLENTRIIGYNMLSRTAFQMQIILIH
jgi:hypothetical protein